MSLNGLHTISVYNNVNGVVAQCNDLIDSEGEVVVSQPFEDNKNPRGEVVYSGDDNTLEFMCYDQAVLAQLEAWEKAGTPVRAVGAGFDKNLQWYEDTLIRVLPRQSMKAGNLNARVIRMSKAGDGLQIYSNENLLAYLGWKDDNADNKVDGYTFLNGQNFNFSSNQQTFEAQFAFDRIFVRVQFPIVGVNITGSVNYVDLATNSQFAVTALNQSLSKLTDPQVTISVTGVASNAQRMPASTFAIGFEFGRVGTLGADNQITVSFPALTTNGKLTSGTSFMDF